MTKTQATWLGMGVSCGLFFTASLIDGHPYFPLLGGFAGILLLFAVNGVYRLGLRHGHASHSNGRES